MSSIAIGPGGTITIAYTGDASLEGKTMVMTPTSLANDYATVWSCAGGTMSRDDRPDVCR